MSITHAGMDEFNQGYSSSFIVYLSNVRIPLTDQLKAKGMEGGYFNAFA
jgi:hypothetical protein